MTAASLSNDNYIIHDQKSPANNEPQDKKPTFDQTTLTTIAPTAITTGHFEPKELPRLQTALTKPATLVLTESMSIVKKAISHQRSTIVVMDDGCGKTAILDWLNEEMWGEVPDETTELLDPDEWVSIPNATHEDTLVQELWRWMGSPSPAVNEFETNRTISKRRPFYIQLRCHHCRRDCILTQVEIMNGFGGLRFEDCDVQIGLNKISGCPLIRNKVLNNISEFKQNIAIEVPQHLSPPYLEILRHLAPNRTLILLCPPEAQATLRETFPGFLVKNPEPLSVGDLLAIFSQRLVDAGMVVSPLPPQAVVMLALMSKNNARWLIEKVGDLIDSIENKGITETVSAAWVGNKIGREIGNELAIQLILSSFRTSGRDWIAYTELQKELRATFGLRLTRTKLGTILSDMGVEMKRKGRKKVTGYYIGDFVMTNNQ